MFNFLKRNKQTKITPKENLKKELSEEEKEALILKIKAQECVRENLLETDTDSLAKYYEELGVLQAELDIDQGIISLEKSFSYKQSVGEGYKTLMHLYNQKRSEAAHQGDGDGIEKWMGKMDELRQIARKNTISSQ